VMSIQIEVMLDLRNGTVPATFRIMDKDEIKDFIYTEEGPARLRTALGELDTRSSRAGAQVTTGCCGCGSPLPWLRAGPGGTFTRRQARIRHPHQVGDALSVRGLVRRAWSSDSQVTVWQ